MQHKNRPLNTADLIALGKYVFSGFYMSSDNCIKWLNLSYKVILIDYEQKEKPRLEMQTYVRQFVAGEIMQDILGVKYLETGKA